MKTKSFFAMLMACFVMLLATSVDNHSYGQTLMSKKPTTDTLVNTDTSVVTADIIPDGSVIAIQVIGKKISGTMAGKVFLKASVNGVDYITIDSLIHTDVARSTKIFSVATTSVPALYYQAQFVSSGTVRYLPELYILRRKE